MDLAALVVATLALVVAVFALRNSRVRPAVPLGPPARAVPRGTNGRYSEPEYSAGIDHDGPSSVLWLQLDSLRPLAAVAIELIDDGAAFLDDEASGEHPNSDEPTVARVRSARHGRLEPDQRAAWPVLLGDAVPPDAESVLRVRVTAWGAGADPLTFSALDVPCAPRTP